MADQNKTTASVDRSRTVELPIQRVTRERLLDGMCAIIRRMCRQGYDGKSLFLMDYDERELAIELFSYLEGIRRYE